MFSKIATPTTDELAEILRLHALWLKQDERGVRASLDGATLMGATLPTGETWEHYLAEVLPALLVAGGKSIAQVVEQ